MPSRDEGIGERGTHPGISDNGVRAAGRARLEEIQRARLLGAMVEVVAEHGLPDATVARVVSHAGVSRRTFYEIFEDREACFLASFEEGVARASRYVLDGYDPAARWAERLRSALTGLLTFLDMERGMGQFLFVGSLGAEASALERRLPVLAQMITLVDEGRAEAKGGDQLSSLTAEGVVGGALSVIHRRLMQPEPGRLVELAGPLIGMIVLPYRGPVIARKEIARPVSHAHLASVSAGGGDPLRELDMRLTYRTVRVLISVAAGPGSSNRELGEAAGIADQGQISKLLARLERLELVRNNGLALGKGAPNAWMLTTRGAQVERVLSADGGRRVAAGARSRR